MASATVSSAIIEDHKELGHHYDEICKAYATGDHDLMERWQNKFVWELARHSIGEEVVVYPAFEKYLGEEGLKMAEHDRAEHREVKLDLHKFQNLKPKDQQFKPTIDALFKKLSDHVKEEESHDLPKLEAALSKPETKDDTQSLAKSFERTKMFVPTRSHPSAPDKPPFETAIGLMAAPLDKLHDIFKKFPA